MKNLKNTFIALAVFSTVISTSAAMAEQNSKFSWFVGGSVTGSNTFWSDEVIQEISLSKTNIGISAEAGGKFGNYENIYNMGLTFNYDYLFDEDADLRYPYTDMFSKITTGFSFVSGSFDNYIRVSSSNSIRSDLVFGIGYAKMTERASFESNPLGPFGEQTISAKDNSPAIVFKAGINSEITKYLDWNVSLRGFLPTEKDHDVDFIALFSAGLRLKF